MKGYGWCPDLPDKRDHLYMPRRAAYATLPPLVDLRNDMPPVYDQGQLGSCTANALAGAVEFEQTKRGKLGFRMPSRLFIYYNERVIEGSVASDDGAMIRDGIKTLVEQGVCMEDEWPYDVSQFAVKPSDQCYVDAVPAEITNYKRVLSLPDIKVALASGFPVTIGFTVYNSFESQEVASTGIMPMPDLSKERVVGGHAVLVVGYRDEDQRLIVRNSWGNWGDAGYFYMPYAYVEDTSLSDDWWVINS